MEETIRKADVLIEALPYIRRFQGTWTVIKYGGKMMQSENLTKSLLQNVIFLQAVGIKSVIVHGGGPFINGALDKKKLSPRFVEGLRVTDGETLKIVIETLEKISQSLSSTLKEMGGKPKKFIPSRNITGQVPLNSIFSGKKCEEKDLGFVGEIEKVEITLLKESAREGFIPIISPLLKDEQGNIYNVNADSAASEVASSLKAEKLVFITDKPGIMRQIDEPETLISILTSKQAEDLISEGIISGGMIPKVKAGIKSIQKGVKKVHLIDGHITHALLLEIFTDEGIGTEIIKNGCS